MERAHFGLLIDNPTVIHQGALACRASLTSSLQHHKGTVEEQGKLKTPETIKIGVLGASGYTGSEVQFVKKKLSDGYCCDLILLFLNVRGGFIE